MQRNSEELQPEYPSHKGSDILIAICLIVFLSLVGYGFVVAFPQFKQAAIILAWAFLALVGLVIGYLLWHKREVDKVNLRARSDENRRKEEAHEMQMYLAQTRLYPDAVGNRPHIFNPRTYEVLEVASGNYLQPVPAHYHYETNYSDTSTRAGQEQLAAAQNYEQPQLATIIEELNPNALEFAFGVDPLTGQLAKTTLPKAVHIQLLGASGQGKSRQATSILTQLCARNDTAHLQLCLIDCEGETTSPFQQLPHVRYLADDPKDAAKAFRGLVSELERRDVSRILWPVIFIFVEEFLNLRRTMPAEYRDQALEDYTTLALRGRKRGMFLFSIGQTAYTEKAIRDAQMQFLSSMAFAVKPTAARSAGFTNTELLNKLYQERRPGQFLLERPAGDSILLAPYVDPGAIPGLLNPTIDTTMVEVSESPASHQRPTSEPGRNPLEAALEAKREQVRQLIVSGTVNKPDIILAVWGVRSGSSEKYKQAEQEYKQIMAHIAKEQG